MSLRAYFPAAFQLIIILAATLGMATFHSLILVQINSSSFIHGTKKYRIAWELFRIIEHEFRVHLAHILLAKIRQKSRNFVLPNPRLLNNR